MYIKIYFNNKPLFLCDAIDAAIKPFMHHDDAVFINDFSVPAVSSMIHEMESPKIHAGIFLHTSLEELKEAFWKKCKLVCAGGGLVVNKNNELLMIFRRGKWDLPKGKLDKGETLEQCALREVTEETGVQNITLHHYLLTTYHTYHDKGKFILKESHWYNMSIGNEQPLIPQTEEDIEEAKWVHKMQLPELLGNTLPSIKDVLTAAGQLDTESTGVSA